MKKAAAIFLIILTAFRLLCINVYAQDIKIIVSGEELECDPQPFIDSSSRILVPFRAIFEQLGATVDWNIKTKSIICIKNDLTITLVIGSDKMLVNGSQILIDSPAQVVGGRTFVPLRAISECMGASVKWDFIEKTAYIDFPAFSPGKSGVTVEKTESINKTITAKGDIPVFEAKVNYSVISGNNKGISKINSAIKDTADFLIYWGTGSYGSIDDSAIERYNQTGQYNRMEADVSVKYADRKYISYLSSVKCVTSSVYPVETKQSGVFDLDSGTIVSLDRILRDKDATIEEARNKFYELIEKNPDIYYDNVNIDMDKTYYYLTERGIVFGFNKQEIAPYSTGFVEVEVSR
jgi:hypothetical protein